MFPDRNPTETPETLETRLERAEALLHELRLLVAARHGHGPAVTPPAPCASARLEIDGAMAGRRSIVRMNGALVTLQDSVFIVFLRFLLAHRRQPGCWSTRPDLGIAKAVWMTSRIRRAFREVLPQGVAIIEADGRERFRLNPEIVVGRVDAIALAEHPDGVVRQLAAQWRS